MPPSATGIKAGRAFVEVGVSDKLTAGLKRARKQLSAFGSGVRNVGANLLKATSVAALPIAVSTTVFASFEQSMARVRALTGATGKDFESLSDEAKRLGQSTVFSATQAADAMGFFALAGFDTQKILKAIGPTLNLAAAGQLEIADAAAITTKIMGGMGIAAEDVGNAVDVLTKAMTTANTDLLQLGDAMKFVGPIAKTAGISFEEITAAIQLLSNAGIQGEMAGTTLRQAILSLASPSKEAADKLAEMGVSIVDAQGDVLPLADIIGQLNVALDGLGSGERLDILGQIFTARSASGVAELLSQGSTKLREYTAALQDAGGTAERVADVQLNTLKGAATLLRSALEGLAITVGESLVGPLRVVAHALSQITVRFSEWVKQNRETVVIIAAAIAAVAALGVSLVAIGAAAQFAAFVIGGLGSILAAAKIAFAALSATLAAMLSPIGLVISAVVALAGTILVTSQAGADALQWLSERWVALKNVVFKVIGGIADALAAGDISLAAKILWLSLKLAWQTGVDALNKIWQGARKSFLGVINEMWFGALALMETITHGLEVAWIETTAFLSTAWTNFIGLFKETWLSATTFAKTKIADLQDSVHESVSYMSRVMTNFGSSFKKAWASATSFTTKKMLFLQGVLDRGFNSAAAIKMADAELADTNAEIDRETAKALGEAVEKPKDERTTIEEEAKSAREKIEAEKKAKLAEREAQRKADRKAADDLNEATLGIIGTQFEEAQTKLNEETTANIASTKTALAEARKELDAAIAVAKGKKDAIDAGPPIPQRKIADPLAGLANKLKVVGKTVADKISTTGTFNTSALFGLGQSAAEETAKATAQTAANTAQILNITKRRRRLAFGG